MSSNTVAVVSSRHGVSIVCPSTERDKAELVIALYDDTVAELERRKEAQGWTNHQFLEARDADCRVMYGELHYVS